MIVKLTPPLLNPKTVLKKMAGTRPMRDGSFNISSEVKGNQKIIHCYGHGGSGWTTLFGSVEETLKLIEKTYLPIRVIGAGCIGLTMAIELQRAGFKVAGITAKDEYDIASWAAACYFGMVSVRTSSEEADRHHKIAVSTFKTYQQIEQGKHPYLDQKFVRFLPVYCSRQTEAGVEPLAEEGLIKEAENVILDFGNGVIHYDFIKYMTYFMDSSPLMSQLREVVKNQGIAIESNDVQSFSDLEEEIIVNCSGLGAKKLNDDDKMIGVRGHLILLNEKAGKEHLNYMIYSKMEDGNTCYLFPKSQDAFGNQAFGVIGASFIQNSDELNDKELIKLDCQEFNKICDRNCQFFHGKNFPK